MVTQVDAFERACADGRLDDAIVAFVEAYDHVTLVELLNRLEHAFPVRGEKALTILHPSFIIWVGMSDLFCDAFERLMHAKRIMPIPTSYLTYLADGGMLKLPLVKRPSKAGYKTDHWLPIVLRPATARAEYPPAKQARR